MEVIEQRTGRQKVSPPTAFDYATPRVGVISMWSSALVVARDADIAA